MKARKSVWYVALILIGSLTSFVAQADQANVGSTVTINVGITKLPPPLIVRAFECDHGICASIDTSSNIIHVSCDARPDQLPACMYSPE